MYSGKGGYIQKSGCIRANWLCSGKTGLTLANMVVFFLKIVRIWATLVFIGQKWLYSGKMVAFAQKVLYSDKVVVFGQKKLYSGKT